MDSSWQPFITAIDTLGVVVTCVYSSKAWKAAHQARRDRLAVEQMQIRLTVPPTPRDPSIRRGPL